VIELLVRWPNAGHVLLGNPSVTTLVDGAGTPATLAVPGQSLFRIPDGSEHVLVKVQFKPSLPIPGKGSTAFVTLEADQGYLVDGNTLRPDATPFRMVNGNIIVQNVHPLIDTISAGNAAAGLTVAEVRTEFVDCTAVWEQIAERNLWLEWNHDREREGEVVMIGATGSTPPLWMVNFRRTLEPPSPEVGALVFFRPTLQYHYETVFDPRHPIGQFNINRYLLAPRDPNQLYVLDGAQYDRGSISWWYVGSVIPLRAGFQRALLRSGKPMVMLHPWPQHGNDYGEATTGKLPVLVQGILRMLRGAGYIGINHPHLVPGRLGLAGYSAGGPPTVAALFNNRHLVRELYLSDPNDMPAAPPFLIQWAATTPDFRLRMTGSNHFATMTAIQRAVTQRVSGEAGDLFLTAQPASSTFWNPVSKGGSPYWNFVIQKHPEMQQDFAVRHQFTVFGGPSIEIDATGRITDNVTWLEDFLKSSGF